MPDFTKAFKTWLLLGIVRENTFTNAQWVTHMQWVTQMQFAVRTLKLNDVIMTTSETTGIASGL